MANGTGTGPTLGAVADDVTGGTDLAAALAGAGLRTVQVLGLPGPGDGVADVDAVVVALRTRTAPAAQAVSQSRAAARWLRAAGCVQLYEKYCSTFDSTAQGNIGPVTDALLAETGSDLTVVCPAFPATGRTVYRGHLFVDGVLLAESGMRDHPLTPMTDSNLCRLLQAQTPSQVGAVALDVVRAGPGAVHAALQRLRADGVRMVVVDAVADADLDVLADATRDLPLLTGGSGLGQALRGHARQPGLAAALPAVEGARAVLAGSCSAATLGQLEHVRALYPHRALDPRALAAAPDAVVRDVADWALPRLADGPVVVSAGAPPEQVAAVQRDLGAARAGRLVEQALAALARQLVSAGVRRLVVAGGETAGAVTDALGVRSLRIGPLVDPGVPWTAGRTADGTVLHLALKSGNFGGTDFLERCWAVPA